MRFAKWVFTIAGIYGVVTVLPLYFTQGQMEEMMPPAFNHPEFYFGFIGVTLAWQLAFLLIGRDPAKYRLFMPIAVFEKWSFFLSTLWLFLQARAPQQIMFSATIDLVFGALFLVSFILVGRQAKAG